MTNPIINIINNKNNKGPSVPNNHAVIAAITQVANPAFLLSPQITTKSRAQKAAIKIKAIRLMPKRFSI
jgi:type IV pilus biogenesis protein CpaD/CtpE